MAGTKQWRYEIYTNLSEIRKENAQLKKELNELKKEKYTINLDIDTKTLDRVISNLDKILDGIGKNTNNFKQLKILSDQIAVISTQANILNAATEKLNNVHFGKIVSSVDNIQRSLMNLNATLLEINKNNSNIVQASDNTTHEVVSNEKKKQDAYKNTAKAQSQSQKTITDGAKEMIRTVSDLAEISPNTEAFDEIIKKLNITKEKALEVTKISKKIAKDSDEETFSIKYKDGSTETYSPSVKKDGAYDVSSSNEVIYDRANIEKNINANNAKKQKEIDSLLSEQLKLYKDICTIKEQISKTDTNDTKTLDTLNKSFNATKKKYADTTDKISSDEYKGLYNPKEQGEVINQIWQKHSKNMSENNFAKQQKDNAKKQKEIDKKNELLQYYQSRLDKLNHQKGNGNKNFILSPDGQAEINKFKNTYKTYKSLVDKFNESGGIMDKEDLKNLKSAEQELKKINDRIDRMKDSEWGYDMHTRTKLANKIEKYKTKNTNMSKSDSLKLDSMIEKLRDSSVYADVKKIETEFYNVAHGIRAANKEGKSFIDIIKNKALYGLGQQIAQYFSLNEIIGYLNKMVNTVKELDTALVDLRKTTTMSSDDLKQFYLDANDAAKEYGVTTKQIIDQASSWSRLNKIGLLYGDI